METRFWLIRHAIVAENERARLYGMMDVQLCPDSLVAQEPQYRALAARLPRPARLGLHPAHPHAAHRGGDLRRRLSRRRSWPSSPA